MKSIHCCYWGRAVLGSVVYLIILTLIVLVMSSSSWNEFYKNMKDPLSYVGGIPAIFTCFVTPLLTFAYLLWRGNNKKLLILMVYLLLFYLFTFNFGDDVDFWPWLLNKIPGIELPYMDDFKLCYSFGN